MKHIILLRVTYGVNMLIPAIAQVKTATLCPYIDKLIILCNNQTFKNVIGEELVYNLNPRCLI